MLSVKNPQKIRELLASHLKRISPPSSPSSPSPSRIQEITSPHEFYDLISQSISLFKSRHPMIVVEWRPFDVTLDNIITMKEGKCTLDPHHFFCPSFTTITITITIITSSTSPCLLLHCQSVQEILWSRVEFLCVFSELSVVSRAAGEKFEKSGGSGSGMDGDHV